MVLLKECPICNSQDISFFYSGESDRAPGEYFDLHICKSCNHYFVNPQPCFDRLKKYYTADYQAYNRFFALSDDEFALEVDRARRSRSYRHLKIRPGMKVLDVGCGGGVFLNVLKNVGAVVRGIEPSSHGVKNCVRQGLDVHHGDLTSYIAAFGCNEKFDVVTANHVLEHHPDPVGMLAQMKQLLKSDGKIWVAVPNAGTFFAHALRDKWYSLALPIHLMHFNPGSAEIALKNAGLHADEVYTYSMDTVLWTTIKCYLRHKWFIPMRISNRFEFLLPAIRWLGKKRDATGRGEEIIMSASLPT